ncbi:MAG: hypothetical protein KBC56_00685 [Flavobacterium sp.]|nr:hypothetical protein [Flavobacterium sp.]
MKKIGILLLVLTTIQGYSQEKTISVEKSNLNIQTGVFGFWVNNEFRLSNSIALRAEFGLDTGLFGGDSYDKTGFLLIPTLNIEPRWYYNIAKRANNSKSIKNNSANFITPVISYHPDWFVISNYQNINTVSQISIIPKWGMRRNIGQSNFNYELGAGLGYRAVFFDTKTVNEAALDLHMRIGYNF